MSSRLESFSTELFFEILEYLSSLDLMRAFIGLNLRFDSIIGAYPLPFDCRFLSRFKFDFICRHLQPEQVISLILSDEETPDQVKLFRNHFPYFKQQFIRLHTVEFIGVDTVLSDLPMSVTSISFKRCKHGVENLLSQTLIPQGRFLTHLNVNQIDVLESVGTPLHALTHLTTGCCSIVELNQSIQRLEASITHLNITVNANNITQMLMPCSDRWSRCLTHLSITYDEGHLLLIETLKESLIKLDQLTHLTIVARVVFEVMDGNRWEQIICRTPIIKFNFKFKYNLSQNIISDVNETSLLESFRSPFWLQKKFWFVACHKEVFNTSLNVYSVPRFWPHHVFWQYPNNYPPLSTILFDLHQHSFYTRKIDLVVQFSKWLKTPVHRFSQVNSLRLLGTELPSVETLLSFVDLGQIKKLDISNIRAILIGELHNLLSHAPHLNHLTMKKFDPLLILPQYIRSFKLENNGEWTDVDIFCRRFLHIEHLEVTIGSKAIMIQLIDQLEHLQSVTFRLCNLRDMRNFSIIWFQQNTRRLKEKNFTCQINESFIYLVIDKTY